MKLWLVIYFFGEIAGTVGPLPYATEEQGFRDCTSYSQGVLADARNQKPGAQVTTSDGRVLTHNDVQAICEWHEERPVTAAQWAK